VPRASSSAGATSSATANDADGFAHGRPRDGQPVTGHAVPRPNSTPVPGGGATIIIPGYYGGYYPWAFGGLGFYGGYTAGYYDPLFGVAPYDPYDPYDPYFGPQGSAPSETGGLKLKIKPNNATVYIDGYYVGVVDDYDGVFQKLSIEPGEHRVEVRAPGYETLTFEIRIEPGHTTTYRGELQKLPN
jgi:hypothetical protein